MASAVLQFPALRVYDYLRLERPGAAALVDRLWPRGVAKAQISKCALGARCLLQHRIAAHGSMLTVKVIGPNFKPPMPKSCVRQRPKLG